VLSDPSLIIADPMFLQQGGPPNFSVKVGDRLSVIQSVDRCISRRDRRGDRNG
jgi:hypothetical protein